MNKYKEFKDDLNEDLNESDEINYGNLVRYVPTGSRVQTTVKDKSMRVVIINPLGTSMISKDVPRAEKRMINDVENLINDVSKVVKIKKVDKDVYVFLWAKNNKIELSYEFTINVGSIAEGKKLKKLDDALAFYKKK